VHGIVESSRDTAIVVLSVDESDATVRELMAAGATSYRRKGVAPQVLAESLIESIDAHAAVRRQQY
jgi:DNA-binding NarL/FixJ family response regulator